MSQILLKYFDSDGCDAAWQDVFALKQAIAAKSGEPPRGAWQDSRRERVKAEVVSDPDLHALLIEDRTPKAYIFTQLLSGGQSQDLRRTLEFDLIDEEPSDELIAAFRQELVKRMHNKRTPAIFARASETRQMNLLKAIGARPLNLMNYYKLERPALDMDRLRRERTRLLRENPGITLRLTQYLDDADIEPFARLFTIFGATMAGDNRAPRIVTPEFQRLREGVPGDLNTQYHIIAYDGSEMIGHTNVWLDVRAPEKLNQFMTGVLPEYRGRGIGLLMKCELYLNLANIVPEWQTISTETLSTNVYMQAINERLGFRMTKQGYEMVFIGD
jgi:RimJ/RimL family protein N-acetyltransferase